MIKAELAHHLAKKSNITKIEANRIIDDLLEVMKDTFLNGETITIKGFGIFTPRFKAQRMGHNPQNGEPAVIPARNIVSFKLSKHFQIAMNNTIKS